VSRKYVLIGVEGSHDQAFLSKVLCESLGFSKCEKDSDLEPLWRKFVPVYPPKSGRLHVRLDMPSVLNTDKISVAIYAGEGSNLISNLTTKLSDIDRNSLFAFAIVADADKAMPTQIAEKYHEGFQEYFSSFPAEVDEYGSVAEGSPRVGLFIFPNNVDQGVLDTLLCACGEVAYPSYMQRAKAYIEQFSDEETKHWKPFDREKANIAAVASILKPGKTNTVSITDNAWISAETIQQVPDLQKLERFLRKLLDIEEI
jgi:hypothetical protein